MTEYQKPTGATIELMDTPGPKLYRLDALLQDVADDAAAAHDAYTSGIPRGPISGFSSLDEGLCGAFLPGLHVMHGGPGTGKTALALQMAATCGTPALFVSCEISPLEIMRRLSARVAGVYLKRFKTGELPPDQVRAYALQACESAPALALIDGTAGYPARDWLRDRAAEIRGDNRHILVVVDSLHTWASRRGEQGLTEYEAIRKALDDLEQLAGALKAPVLAIAERNRGSMASGGMSGAKGNARIEYAGETVISMNTEYDTDGRPLPFDASGERPVTLILEKNRNNAPGRVNLYFHGALQRFREEGGGR